jgi:hypothetical protein
MDKHRSAGFSKTLPYAAALAVFFIIIAVYFYPILEGKEIKASDMVQVKGMSKEIVDYRVKTGEEALWTNNMFGGMPAYQISVVYSHNLMRIVNKVVKFGQQSDLGFVFMYFFGFFILLVVLKLNPWLSIAGAIAFALSSYFFIILEAGHPSKASAIGYMAPVIAGAVLTYRGKYFTGGILFTLFLSLEVISSHPQITYYLMLMIIIFGLVELVRHYREKKLVQFFKSTGVLIIAALLAILTNAANLWGTYEYSKYSIRGKSELSIEKENRTSGLDKDYATDWSYGKMETFNLLIPNLYGGSSHGQLSEHSETYNVLKQNRVPNTDEIIKQLPLYWGPQPFTSGPVYIGAIVVFLFFLSLFIVKGPMKWWAVSVTILSIFLAWGKNFMPLTDFFLDYFPLYNKFRAVSMTLIMAELTIPLMAFLGLQKIFEGQVDKKNLMRYGKYTLIITGSILLFFLIFAGSLFSFTGANDASSGLPSWLMDAIKTDRRSILQSDVLRALVFILLTAAMLWGYIAGKLKKNFVLILLPLLILADMWPVAKRYLNNDDFEKKSSVEKPFTATTADLFIKKDKTLYFRVFSLREQLDQSARTSYFHKNIGGYHGAKLRRYQEMIDFPLTAERTKLINALTNQPSEEFLNNALRGLSVINMLNTRYIIIDNNSEPLFNPYALGNAWFVKDIKMVNNADEEIAALQSFNSESTAIVDIRFGNYVDSHPFKPAQGSKINLTDYSPNRLTYEYSSPADHFAVFSDIYYDKGWKAILDGKEVPHISVNYILRGMVLPAGNHKLEFRFAPKSYYAGQTISLISSSLLILLILTWVVFYSMQWLKGSNHLKKNQD